VLDAADVAVPTRAVVFFDPVLAPVSLSGREASSLVLGQSLAIGRLVLNGALALEPALALAPLREQRRHGQVLAVGGRGGADHSHVDAHCLTPSARRPLPDAPFD